MDRNIKQILRRRLKNLKKCSILGFHIIEPENLSFKHETKSTKKKKSLPKRGKSGPKKRRKQKEGVLSRYDFAYAGRDGVNQAAKVAPVVIKQVTNDIDLLVKNRLNQAITSGGAEIERVLPQTLRGAIEDVYKTPFRLLGKFGKTKFNKNKNKILR